MKETKILKKVKKLKELEKRKIDGIRITTDKALEEIEMERAIKQKKPKKQMIQKSKRDVSNYSLF